MGGEIVFGKSAREYFREMVDEALAHRHLRIGEVTEFYLVNLLATFLERERLFQPEEEGSRHEPLALMLKRALEGDRETRYRNLRRLGDTSLFVSGFFGDSIARSLVDVDYYIAMGERAYDTLSGRRLAPGQGFEEPFGELAERFADFVDLFAEIAELSDLSSNRGLVRLYQRFLVTGSQRVAERLRERGVTLLAGRPTPRGLVH